MRFLRRDLCAAQLFASQFFVGSVAGSTLQAQLYVPLRVHDDATITQATLTFAIAQPHPSPPLKTVTMRVLRVDASGNKTPLTSAAAGADQYGFVAYAPFPSSGAGWFDGGAVKSLVVTCDQNNAVDVSQYTYYAHIVDEQGLTDRPFAAIILPPVDSVSRFANFDLTATSGYGRTAGGRYLLVSQKNPAENGIWTWQPDPDHFPDPPTGKYVRYPDAAIGDTHPVLAQTGEAYWTGYGTWYCAPGLPKDLGPPLVWTVEPSQTAGGNIFHAVAVKHEGISRMGFA
ncbi:hypothetical protein LZC95_08090 [Pendulispora brunnea]|uniref:DUF946 domain-containing protein n=1 Tax=Pendulispora brunnea TaxID=2905690 RepID=A0ABZ2KDN2_9BACT